MSDFSDPAVVPRRRTHYEKQQLQCTDSCAITSLYAGDDIKAVQANLGHATAQFTLDTYGHVMQKMRHDNADRMQSFYEQLSK